MSINIYALDIGDKIIYDKPGGEPLEMTVSQIWPPMSMGRAESAGPSIVAHIRPGGYSISFDAHSSLRPHIRLSEG